MRLARRDQFVDIAVSGVLTALVQFQIWIGPITQIGDGPVSGPKPLLTVVALGLTAPLAIRRRWPLFAVTVVMADFAAHTFLTDGPFGRANLNLFEAFLALVLIVYSTAANTTGRRTWIGAGIIVTGQVVGSLTAILTVGVGPQVGSYFFYALAWFLGKTIQHRNELSRRLADRAATLEQTRDAEVEQAVGDERSRMARELHDVVSHSVSLMTLQAGAARQALDVHPQRARQQLLGIESTGREAMVEMRRLLGLLREAPDGLALEPQPSLRHLDLLVERMKEAGLPVLLSADDIPTSMPRGVDLTAYRIVQEGLTNVLKHANPSCVQVTIRVLEQAIEIEVEDDGSPRPVLPGSHGHGLIGMRERVAVYGGELDAGPAPGRGFRLKARIPFERS
ncbi:MAG TPA: sensor histidine kinase [Candidatus Dormibacteraeota bacterium]